MTKRITALDAELRTRVERTALQLLTMPGCAHLTAALVPICSEDVKFSYTVEFFLMYFLCCAVGQGAPQKPTTYQKWLEESGLTVTKVIAQNPTEMPANSIAAHGILCAMKK
ncbi:hypothetical protein [Actinomadura alba]|uniref:hypothetical protein n=1 Tax=Actinomadura alba TaxID=406431 RepID=UPI00164F5AF6